MTIWRRPEDIPDLTIHDRAPLIASHHDGLVLVSMEVGATGDYLLAFSVTIAGDRRTLPEVEDFARRVAAFIYHEPVDTD